MTVTPLMLVVVFASMLVSGFLVPLLVRFAVGRNLLDMPNTRSSHEVPTPRLGGVAVMAGTWAGFLALFISSPDSVTGSGMLPLMIGATVVGGVGLADDFMDLHFGVKAAAQAVAAGGLLLASPPALLSSGPDALRILLLVFGVFWVVALCNAFNFMDGIDGITGGVAAISAPFIVALVGGTAGFIVALVGAMVGFLVWNIGPATIFMGDAGSYFAGFALAAAALYVPISGGGIIVGLVGLLACLLVFTPYLFDTGFTIARRLSSGAGRGIFSAHREHIYQRITPEPAMHRRTSNIYYALSAVSGFGALLVASGGVFGFLAGVGTVVCCCALMLMLPGITGNS